MNGRERARVPASVEVSIKDLLAILGGGKRLEILVQLARQPSDVQSLSRECDLDEADVSKNLRVLRDLRLVEFRQIKKHRRYSLATHVTMRGRGDRLRLGLDSTDGVRLYLLIASRTGNQAREAAGTIPELRTNGTPAGRRGIQC
jgi:DNA-binding transcriptional ArsR family regulator